MFGRKGLATHADMTGERKACLAMGGHAHACNLLEDNFQRRRWSLGLTGNLEITTSQPEQRVSVSEGHRLAKVCNINTSTTHELSGGSDLFDVMMHRGRNMSASNEN